MPARAALSKMPGWEAAGVSSGVWFSLGSVLFFHVPVLVSTLAMSRGNQRIKREVQAARGRACVNCVYDPIAFEDTGTCPECGHPFETGADQRRWAWDRLHK